MLPGKVVISHNAVKLLDQNLVMLYSKLASWVSTQRNLTMTRLLYCSLVLQFLVQSSGIVSAQQSDDRQKGGDSSGFARLEIITSKKTAPIRRTPPISGMRFSSPGAQFSQTKINTEYAVLERRAIRQGFSKQVWVKIAPVKNVSDTHLSGWVYWGRRAEEQSQNFRKRGKQESPSDPKQSEMSGTRD